MTFSRCWQKVGCRRCWRLLSLAFVVVILLSYSLPGELRRSTDTHLSQHTDLPSACRSEQGSHHLGQYQSFPVSQRPGPSSSDLILASWPPPQLVSLSCAARPGSAVHVLAPPFRASCSSLPVTQRVPT
ncbi:hypothetical protein F5Y15DRAFT_359552 [Xylariaceae sp. FL0016]|nr:hypothetical protein F5Y15DRAFT_359552 [Xylariaceae sp. FL0016]